ncbi:MAG: hypothetical protein FWF52_02815 [Candidatus Azobacteroides sp.]|nr:hypothetical protein [Candidatus Azobacteroides sp.]
MSTITDWLTAIGTVTAVILSLSYTIFSHYIERKRKRYKLIHNMLSLTEKFFREIEGTGQNQTDISQLNTYKSMKIFQTVILFSADAFSEDIVMIGDNLFSCLLDYFYNRSDMNKEACFSLIEQLKQMS